MLDEIINNPDIEKYIQHYEIGQDIFLEGDNTQDLYILLSGQLDVLKGDKHIAEIKRKGALFGEMSFLLNTGRTATTRAKNDVQAIRIPSDEITEFLKTFPVVSAEITRILAQRLNKTSHVLYGLKEFSDQIPDAVVLTDKNGKILTMNSASEKLYGQRADRMRHQPMADLFEKPDDHARILEEIKSKDTILEKTLTIRHPQKGTRFVSASMTCLYDANDNFQGVCYLGRDATVVENLKRRYKRIRLWLIPAVCILIFLAGAVFFGYPYFSKGIKVTGTNKNNLKNILAKDFALLKLQLYDDKILKDPKKIRESIRRFLAIQDNVSMPYTAILLMDKGKKVVSGCAVDPDKDISGLFGSSYAGIDFQGEDSSLHKILELYRTDEEHPMGYKGVEIAMEIYRDNDFLGWLVFQMNMSLLKKDYDIELRDLFDFTFTK